MPNRIIREGFLTSDKVDKLSWVEECFYHRLLLAVDDYGRYHADPPLLIGKIMPRKIGNVSNQDIEKWLTACVTAGLVRVYGVEGKRYLEVLQFDQRTRAKKSKFPAPDEEKTDACQSNDGHVSDICQSRDRHPLAYTETESNTNTSTKSETETETETETKEAAPDGSLAAPSRSSLPLPSSPEEVEAYLKNEVARCRLKLLPRDVSECALQYWADRGGSGWVDKFSCPIADWKANALGYALRWARNLDAKGQLPGEESDPFDPKFRKNI